MMLASGFAKVVASSAARFARGVYVITLAAGIAAVIAWRTARSSLGTLGGLAA